MMNAPVALFVYNRPLHTRRTLMSLSMCGEALETDLFIFCDGLKNGATEDVKKSVEEVRKVIRERKWCRNVEIIESAVNKGLSRSVIAGATEIVNRFEKIIVLEDDMEVSPFFLKYMNEGLALYERDEAVISLTGYCWPVKEKLPETFFLLGTYCWGWATWKRGWDLFDPDGSKLLRQLEEKNLTSLFDFNDSHFYTRMLKDQVEGKNDSWALPWYAAAFLQHKLTLIPGRSLVRNTGIDGTGVHSGESDEWAVELSSTPVEVARIPLEDSTPGRGAVTAFFRSMKRNSLPERLKRKIRSFFPQNN
ncbi:MAG: glycosyltransferase family 2 protein [Bacteroidetes bacterium]|nr:glycosyltransferase family 2 protein [Bacteroidota bacterium]